MQPKHKYSKIILTQFKMTIEEFHTDLLDQIRINSNSYNLPSEQSLFSIYIDFLQGSGQFVEETIDIEYGINSYNFSAFARDVERGELSLFVTDLKSGIEPEKIYQKDLEVYFKGLNELLSDVIIPAKNELDESNPIREFTDDLCSDKRIYNSLTIWYLTNGLYSSRSISELSNLVGQVKVSMRVVDINSYRNMVADQDQQNIEIDCQLEGIKVIETPHYTSYLTIISGHELVRYYEQYGKRLLESNVRTFLSLRGNVNKGIYNTLRSEEKHFFFAYNNGISATASEVYYDNGKIKSVKNLQIVNGGQTMSTIYKAKRDGLDLDQVQVQMKLSVIHEKENYTLYVSKISEYANTQNKVEKSDFFSNSYFHRRFKELSKLLRIPARGGNMVSSKWFYERVKGEYLNDQMYMRDGDRRRFLLEFPQDQVIDKIIVAKVSLSWDLFPYEVSKGAQIPFAIFADKVSDLFDEGDPDCNEFLFQKTVSQVILYKKITKLVGSADWYSGGYRAQTVPYIISTLSYILRTAGLTINWDKIWREQDIEQNLLNWINSIGEIVHFKLLNPPDGNTNIGTFCKKKLCWEGITSLANRFNDVPEIDSFITINEEQIQNTRGRQRERLDNGINNQIRVLELSRTQTPRKIIEFYNSPYSPGITEKNRGVLRSWYEGRIDVASEKQANVIIDLINKAIDAGFTGVL
jgi:hypothetical protein